MTRNFRLTADEVEPSGTELADIVKPVLVADSTDYDLLHGIYRLLESTPYRLRLSEIVKEEQHYSIQFRRAQGDTPFVT